MAVARRGGYLVALSLALISAASLGQPPMPPASNPSAATAPEMSVLRVDPALDAVIAPDAKIERVATGFTFTEGPLWRKGRLWFADVRADKLRAMTPDGKVELLSDNPSGVTTKIPGLDQGSDGMVPDKDGTILAANQGGRNVIRMDDKLHTTVFLDSYDGKKLNSPNDLVFAPDGSLWITDPPYGLRGMDRSPDKEQPYNAVYRYANGKLTPVITDLTIPNGIGFSPDGKILYVSNSGPQQYVKAWDVAKDGTVSNGRVLISYQRGMGPGIPDGLKVDSAGNLWTTGPGGIRIITPEGKVLGQIKLPEVAANLCFAEDGRTVYITASTSIYRLHIKIPGELPLYYDRQR